MDGDIGLCVGLARADDLPTDPKSFTENLLILFTQADVKNDVTAPLQLSLRGPNGRLSVSLTSLHDACVRDASHCKMSAQMLVASLKRALTAPSTNATADRVRVNVRPLAYVKDMEWAARAWGRRRRRTLG